ncbi:MAG: type 4a pilus biogenesis protein PilO [candidate division Zixibacteria bacterium]|nr:type 4a pilus biogenesis protein PilO [candidate division Zixibacteria bacterium]NIS16906.1 type 4a pilus biogenesis protein PilO [candidate division Zixibacteria bacterium]NIS45185.1 type 4a pilus biogenesis protein PilO [candidate division Zixibacteria bacterium]NIT51758.1 type 4a pilus biogenesis protein PilO [candidate division Zixibacteria bacterium]NIU17446.1 type 4a pilus biogenesis protein PilO [candidate division Zixibacteria bacterium]
MMDIKDPRLHKIAIGVLVVVVLVIFWHSRFYSQYVSELDQKQARYEKLMTELNQVKLKAKSLKGLQEEYEQLLERYDKVQMLLPSEKQVAQFLMQLHTASARTQSRVIELAPKSERSKDFYKIADYEIKFNGTFHEFGEFLASAANFPFITNVSEISVKGLDIQTRKSEKEKNFDDMTLEAKFTLSTYYVKEGQKLAGIQP